MPYKRYKDKTGLIDQLRVNLRWTHYLHIYVWEGKETLNECSGIEQECIACYIPMPRSRGMFGEIHLAKGDYGAGVVAHEVAHFLCDWANYWDMDLSIDNEELAQAAEKITQRFWLWHYSH